MKHYIETGQKLLAYDVATALDSLKNEDNKKDQKIETRQKLLLAYKAT